MSRRRGSSFQLLCLVTVLVVVSVAASACNAWASDLGNEEYAKHEAACFIFGTGADEFDADVHADRVRAQIVDAQVITYDLGYHTGTLDAYGALGAGTLGSYEKARKEAATILYEAFKCTTAVNL